MRKGWFRHPVEHAKAAKGISTKKGEVPPKTYYPTYKKIGIKHLPFGKEIGVFKVKTVPNSVMGNYIALHGLVPQNEMPTRLRGQIPKDEIWVREDLWKNRVRRDQVIYHEKVELHLMKNYGYPYRKAHNIAEFIDGPG